MVFLTTSLEVVYCYPMPRYQLLLSCLVLNVQSCRTRLGGRSSNHDLLLEEALKAWNTYFLHPIEKNGHGTLRKPFVEGRKSHIPKPQSHFNNHENVLQIWTNSTVTNFWPRRPAVLLHCSSDHFTLPQLSVRIHSRKPTWTLKRRLFVLRQLLTLPNSLHH